ncbi:CC_3452 family protein, partial [Brevundimonas sp.]
TASGGASQPAARACRRVVAKLGPVTAFSYKGEALDAQALAACNAG